MPPRISRPNISAAIRRQGGDALRNIAQGLSTEVGRSIPAPLRGTTEQTESPSRTDIYTYFTQAVSETKLMFTAEKWCRVRLLLETAGPVAVSTRQDIVPVLSGKGIVLQTGEYVEFTLNRGDRLFIASTAVNRVQVFVEPFPWLESIILTLKQILRGA